MADNAGSVTSENMEPEEKEGQKSENINHAHLFTTNTQMFRFFLTEVHSPSKWCQTESL